MVSATVRASDPLFLLPYAPEPYLAERQRLCRKGSNGCASIQSFRKLMTMEIDHRVEGATEVTLDTAALSTNS